MKTLALTLFLFVVSFSSISQDLRNQILNFSDSSQVLIENSRKLIIKELDDWNTSRAIEIKTYLDENMDHDRYHVFSLGEELLLSLYINDFHKPLLISEYLDSLSSSYYGYPPIEDNFFNIIGKLGIENKEKIIQRVHEIVRVEPQRDYLILLFQALLSSLPDAQITQDSLNEMSKSYIEKYKYSPYNSFIKKMILYELEVTPFGFSIFMGSGWVSVPTSTKDYLDIYTPAIMGFDFMYKRALVSLKIIGGGGGIAQDFQWKNETYLADSYRLNPFLVVFGAGVDVLNTNRFSLYPVGWVGNFSISPVDDSDSNLDLSSFAMGFGGILDIKLWDWDTRNIAYGPNSPTMNNEVGIRLSYDHISYEFEKTVPSMKGRYAAYGITLYWIFRSKRIKQF